MERMDSGGGGLAAVRVIAERYPVGSFLVAAYVIQLVSDIPVAAASRGLLSDTNPALGLLGVLAAVGPALAAVVVAGLMAGRGGVDGLLQALFRGASRPAWYVLVLMLQVALSGLALLFAVVTESDQDVVIDWVALPVVTLSVLFMFTLWEELGFRGFAQREAQKRYSPLIASLLVGLAWAVWHVPVWLTAGGPTAEAPVVLLLLDIVGVSVVYAWVYNRTAQSVLFVSLLHAAGNAVGLVAAEGGVDLGRLLALKVPLVWLAVAVLIVVFGPNLQASSSTPQAAR